MKEIHRAANKRDVGYARRLRYNHGYSKADAWTLAQQLADPNSRCGICGIPTWVVRLQFEKGGPFLMGTSSNNQRLHVDHIAPAGPSTLENTRLLCSGCNIRRGARERTDEVVLKWVSRQWKRKLSPRLLWWLNTTPGEGGRLHRNDTCRKRDARLADEKPGVIPTEPSNTSPL